jgi:hypothetical protein
MSGYRPDLSDIDALPSYLDLIEKGWSGSISARPSAQGTLFSCRRSFEFDSHLSPLDMVEELQNLWTLFIHPVCEELSVPASPLSLLLLTSSSPSRPIPLPPCDSTPLTSPNPFIIGSKLPLAKNSSKL